MINNLQEWKSGSGQKTSFQKILQIMKQHSKKNGTVYHLAKMLIGYVKGSGYDCRIKPHAFAANSIADRHSK